jgi:hypothetical protein
VGLGLQNKSIPGSVVVGRIDLRAEVCTSRDTGFHPTDPDRPAAKTHLAKTAIQGQILDLLLN